MHSIPVASQWQSSQAKVYTCQHRPSKPTRPLYVNSLMRSHRKARSIGNMYANRSIIRRHRDVAAASYRWLHEAHNAE
jgi:hypothetical protein